MTDEQLSFLDIEIPKEPQKPQRINPAKIPDEEYSNISLDHIPTVTGILKMLDKATYKVGRHEFMADLFECSAIAVSNRVCYNEDREKKYLSIMKNYDQYMQQLIVDVFSELFILLSNQTSIGFGDYLGELYMMSETSNSKSGQFFTPYHVSKMCAETNIDGNMVTEYMEQDRILTLHEPTCGSGGMVIAAADVLYNKYHFNYARNLLVECGDIDKRCVHMCYLQLSLAGIPAVVYHRNALTLETWDRWETPAYTMQWLRFRKFGR